MEEVARDFETGGWVRLKIDRSAILAVDPADGPPGPDESDPWVAPAFWDLQVNGRRGVSFADPGLTVDQVVSIVKAQAGLGTSRFCPTVITAPRDVLLRAVATIAAACESLPEVAERVLGIHLEGPYISHRDGYRGAHRLDAVRDPDWAEFQRLQEAAVGRIALLTLAPERSGSIDFIRKVTAAGVAVALGHTAADGPTIRAAVDAGARLSTHLGNGIASELARHPNPIWEQAAIDDLSASLIADGHHLDPASLKVLVRAKGPERVILVSDASPLAGLPPGRYGEWAVDPSGKVVVAGTPYLAGSNQGLSVGLDRLLMGPGVTLTDALAAVTRNPARLLGRAEPSIRPGQPANFVLFRRPRLGDRRGFELLRTCVDGQWAEPAVDPKRTP
jgi:N-acetylglucosamine-6-phosphate deacetylase